MVGCNLAKWMAEHFDCTHQYFLLLGGRGVVYFLGGGVLCALGGRGVVCFWGAGVLCALGGMGVVCLNLFSWATHFF